MIALIDRNACIPADTDSTFRYTEFGKDFLIFSYIERTTNKIKPLYQDPKLRQIFHGVDVSNVAEKISFITGKFAKLIFSDIS